MRIMKICIVVCFSVLVIVSFGGCGGGGGSSVGASSAGNPSTSAATGFAKLTWDAPANPDGTLAGFKVYYGTSPGAYSNVVNVGMATSYTISGLASGTYYFVVTAYDAAGNESGYSNEASKTIS